MIVIQEYDPRWPAEFEKIRHSLQEALGPLALRIDHIGSTSVPGLGAKNVIDIQITVAQLDPHIITQMTKAGFVHQAHISSDHVPRGEPAEPKLWAKYIFCEPPGQRRANIHIRVAGMPNQRYPLLFRDYLRAHPGSAMSIELIKRELAQRHADDAATYYAIKDPVYDLIWVAADEWARFTNWQI